MISATAAPSTRNSVPKKPVFPDSQAIREFRRYLQPQSITSTGAPAFYGLRRFLRY
jgi:hypothetical protein